MKTSIKSLALVLAAASLGQVTASAQTETFSFFNITGNNSGDAAIGEAQLFVDVTDLGFNAGENANQVLFNFRNTGPDQSTISEIYFDDGTLLGIASIIDRDTSNDPMYDEVDFSQGANPPNLPGANGIIPPFQVTAGFLADADNPAPRLGVSPDEQVGIIFNLQSGQTYNDVIDDLLTDVNPVDGAQDLRIGLHVINFASGGSESFVNDPTIVPEPAHIASLMGLVALATICYRKRKQN